MFCLFFYIVALIIFWYTVQQVTVSFLRSPGLFDLFRPLRSGWSLLHLWLSILRLFFQVFRDRSRFSNYNWYHYHHHFHIFFFSSQARLNYFSIFLISLIFDLYSAETAKSTRWQVLSLFFFCCLVVWLRLGDLFVSQDPREFYASHFLGRVLVCSNDIW